MAKINLKPNSDGHGINMLVEIINLSIGLHHMSGNETVWLLDDLTSDAELEVTGKGFGYDVMTQKAKSGTINGFNASSDGDIWITGTGVKRPAKAPANFEDMDEVMTYLLKGYDQVKGTDGNGSIMGFAGNDSLIGGLVTDMLLGMGGKDRLKGGAGRDTFVFEAPTKAGLEEVITDFNPGEVNLRIDAAWAFGLRHLSANQLAIADADDRVIHDRTSGRH
jgi:Ca2+-binding RTX toxin-like protein